ncbi:unnamed protein product [Protopolystoma xenopodis]|uniref:Uncharacterized protein n=1 Tax=Protopolystoma xenopodis TaxID=117903 RepID=A0A3S5B9N3_9PLAT|nr:unnamed protein product [Protopolystoma xenopodis]
MSGLMTNTGFIFTIGHGLFEFCRALQLTWNVRLLGLLLDFGADINQLTDEGYSSLGLSLLYYYYHYEQQYYHFIHYLHKHCHEKILICDSKASTVEKAAINGHQSTAPSKLAIRAGGFAGVAAFEADTRPFVDICNKGGDLSRGTSNDVTWSCRQHSESSDFRSSGKALFLKTK